MSSGVYFLLGMAAGALLTGLFTVRRRPVREPVGEVSAETLARARELVARGKIIHAVKVVRDETGWDLKRAKAVVDGLPRQRKDDGFGHFGGTS